MWPNSYKAGTRGHYNGGQLMISVVGGHKKTVEKLETTIDVLGPCTCNERRICLN